MKHQFLMLGLLAAVPLASQAAMVQMDDASLSDVKGGAFSFGWNLNPTANFGFANSPAQFSTGFGLGTNSTKTFSWSDNVTPTKKHFLHQLDSDRSFPGLYFQ